MSLIETKSAILESLNEMDRNKSEQVLSFIQELLDTEEEVSYEKFKEHALEEINKALSTNL